MRSILRMTGVSINTVSKLLVDAGKACAAFHDEAMRGRSLRRGILPFLQDGSEVPDELTAKYRGPVRQSYLVEDE